MKKNTFKTIMVAVCFIITAVFFVSCAQQAPPEAAEATTPPTAEAPGEEPTAEASAAAEDPMIETPAESADTQATTGEKPKVEITMADGGKILVELDPEAAPLSVANFLMLVEKGFYDGLIFHRVIPGFMIQGGDPTGTGVGNSDEEIKGEFSSNGWDNPISHKRGVISMARSMEPDSASCQFFITHADSEMLDGEYAAFGTVLEGMDVVDKITAVALDSMDKPLEDVVMESIKIVE